MPFILHPCLKKDCIALGKLELCHVLLMNDSQFPWIILVPDRENITEIYQLPESEQQLLAQESSWVSQKMAEHYQADKMNIAALGNLVPQLHIHHIVRYTTDKLWPAPIWGVLPAQAYTEKEVQKIVPEIQNILEL